MNNLFSKEVEKNSIILTLISSTVLEHTTFYVNLNIKDIYIYVECYLVKMVSFAWKQGLYAF